MGTYLIPKSLQSKYRGAGHAMAAIVDNEIVEFVYLYDVLPEFDGDLGTAMEQAALAPTVRYLSAVGCVSIGMLCEGRFTELQ